MPILRQINPHVALVYARLKAQRIGRIPQKSAEEGINSSENSMDFLAGACELFGKWIVGNKNRWGFLIQICGSAFWIYVAVRFLIQICGSAFWIYVAVTHKLYGLLLVTIGCVVANLRNWWKWRKEAQDAVAGKRFRHDQGRQDI
jgi:hypothetical protein